MKLDRALTLAGAFALALSLGGCVSLFPKTAPVQMYAFGQVIPPADAAGAPGGPPFNVVAAPVVFERAAAGDRLLTVDGQSQAYIAGSRWVSPAVVLFQEAETRAFAAAGGRARLVRPADLVKAQIELQLDVPTFEVRYPNGLKAPPTVAVVVRATLIGLPGRSVLAKRTFVANSKIAENHVGDIVRGFDSAVIDVLNQITAWTSDGAALAGG